MFVHCILLSEWFTTKSTGVAEGARKMNVLNMLLSTAAVTKTLPTYSALLSLWTVFWYFLDVEAKVWSSICYIENINH